MTRQPKSSDPLTIFQHVFPAFMNAASYGQQHGRGTRHRPPHGSEALTGRGTEVWGPEHRGPHAWRLTLRTPVRLALPKTEQWLRDKSMQFKMSEPKMLLFHAKTNQRKVQGLSLDALLLVALFEV